MNLYHCSRNGASVSLTSNGFRFTIPESRLNQFRLAQVDGYARRPRREFSIHPPSTLSLRLRASSKSIPGTWGFGLWNDPFGLSLGFGGNPLSLPALPNAIWFFHASAKNHLSFRDDKPAQGFFAQAMSSPQFHPLLLPVGLTFPFSKKNPRRLLGNIIEEDGATISANAAQWHSYRCEWSPSRSRFWVDEALVLDTLVSPRPPLGLVIWMDNQYAAFTPDGKLKRGLENNLTEAWLEIENVEMRT